MALPISGQVGPISNNANDGANTPFRQGHTGELVVQELHGRYAETMARGAMFTATNQSAQAVSAALATTYTGLLIYNPPGSGILVAINKLKFALSVAPTTTATIGIISGFAATGGVTAATTAATIASNQVGSTKRSAALAYSAATITTPVWLAELLDGFTALAFPAPTPIIDLEGAYGILPGGYIAIGALTSVTGLGSISWEELPYNVLG